MSADEALAAITAACGDQLSLPADVTEQAFAEPWQAEVFAITIQLHEGGHFSWPEWARALSSRLAESQDPSGSDYYLRWSQALVDILDTKGLITRASLHRLEEQWHSAAARTPHGQPIRLEAGYGG